MSIDHPLILATTFRKRLQGFFRVTCDDAVLLISPCRAIHTIGMSHPLDIAFVDQEGVVIKSERNVGIRFFIKERKAQAVLERKARCDQWFEVGDQVIISFAPRKKETSKDKLIFEN